MFKNIQKAAIAALALAVSAGFPAQAAIVSFSGGTSTAAGLPGASVMQIAAPSSVLDDAAFNTGIQGFDEKQGVLLSALGIEVDSGFVGGGMRVDSQMIFLNSEALTGGCPGGGSCIEHGAGVNANVASFTFSGMILGVMSDSSGNLEVASSAILGAVGTVYPVSGFPARGMEGDPLDGLTNDDWYSFSGNTIMLGMRVSEPGDWIRVVTVSPVPVPASAFLLGSVLLGFGAVSARRRRKARLAA